jgi:hypothetical protein
MAWVGSRRCGWRLPIVSFLRAAIGCNRSQLCGRLAPMTLAEFQRSLAGKTAPRGVAPPLVALWWAQRGDWDKAHKIVMDESGRAAAWVHAYLHRLEGDADNAAYWYRQARRPAAAGAHDTEWAAIAAALLGEEA